MKKQIMILSACIFIGLTSCDPKDKRIENENPVEQQQLEEEGTPEQYQGSTGVEDSENNNLDAPENIGLKVQDFTGSLNSDFTSEYKLTVVNPAEYTFTLNTGNPDINYWIVEEGSQKVIKGKTSGETTINLPKGEYWIKAGLKEGVTTTSGKTDFNIHIQ